MIGYYRPDAPPVLWETADSTVLANPEWVRRERVDLGEVRRRLPGLDRHVWVATSGTSGVSPGRARWAGLSKDAFLASARAVNAHLASGPDDVWGHALPVFHVGGLGILARAHLSGARVAPVVAGAWDVGQFLEALIEQKVTLTALVPAQIHDLVTSGRRAPAALRAVIVGGARLEPSLYREARRLGWPCLPSYGLTETCSQVATAGFDSLAADRYPVRLPVLAHAEIRADGDRRLSIRATSLLTVFVELPDDEGATIWDPKSDGWIRTEDLGLVGDAGVEVLGRASESVKVLGELVWLVTLEERAREWAVAERLFGVAGFDFALVALPHDRLGHEIVMAATGGPFDTARRRELARSLASFCRRRFLPFERIQRVAWVATIPRTALGKIRRNALARDVSATDGGVVL